MSIAVDFASEKEAAYQRVFGRSPLLSSLNANWQGIYLAHDYLLAGESPEVSAKQHGVAIFTHTDAAIQVERVLDGQFRQEQVAPGNILVTPADITHWARWYGAGGVILLGFDASVLAQASYDVIDPDRAELLPHFTTPDPLIQQMGLALKTVLEQSASGSRLYAETMMNALIMHLLQHYSARSPQWRDNSDGLSRSQWRQVKDYIQAHLDRDLGLEELAAVTQISSHYFCQLFKQTTGMTPHQYVIRCRIQRAKMLLRHTNQSIASIAKQVGFADQSHLTRHFKRCVGVTPKVFLQQCKP